MKKVYVITSLCDYEHGCRKIESIWDSIESAESRLKELGGREKTAMWNSGVFYKHDIEEWVVQE